MRQKSVQALPPLVACEWNTREHFLLHCIHPFLHSLTLNPLQPALPQLKRHLGDERLFLFHINLTRQNILPLDRRAVMSWLASRKVTVLNRSLADLTKRNLQKLCARAGLPSCRARRHGDPAEPLIVKSNNNCGDIGERALPEKLATRLKFTGSAMPFERVRLVRRRDIADEIWHNPSLTVETYIHNDEGRFFRAYVLGKRLVTAQARSPGVFKEMQQRLVSRHRYTSNYTRHPKSDSDEISVAGRLCRALELDFGAIDLMQNGDGTFYPVDVNPTPFWGGEDQDSDLVQFLRRGWRQFAGRRQPRREAASSS